MIKCPSANNLLESYRRLPPPLNIEKRFRHAVHARGFVFGGGRSANRYA
jgi:hypothetical protein